MQKIYFENVVVFKNVSDEKIDNLSKQFLENDYCLLKDVLTDEIKEYLKNKITFHGNDLLTDKRQFYRSHHDEQCTDIIDNFLIAIHPFYEIILKKSLNDVRGFSMKYNDKSDLLPHYDNYDMPISSTICFFNEEKIEYPIYLDKDYFKNPYLYRLTVDDKSGIPYENKIKIDINEGDIGIFRGRNHLHWRDRLDIKDYRAILLHMQDYSYKGEHISYSTNADVNNIKNINEYFLTDLDSYEQFRKNYVMFF